jgi:hypothetical protein
MFTRIFRLSNLTPMPIFRLVLALAIAIMPLTSLAAPAYAQGGDPGAGNGGGRTFAGQPLVDVLYELARLVMQVVVFGSVALLAANLARGTFSAQIANLVGSPMGVSQAWLNILSGIFTFTLAVLSPVLVGIVFDTVKGFVDTSFTIPTF